MRAFGRELVPQAVIIDLDGTLYPREVYIEQVVAVVRRMQEELRGILPRSVLDMTGELARRLCDDWETVSATGLIQEFGFSTEEWHDFRRRHLDLAVGLQPAETVMSQLARLRIRLPIALLTNNSSNSTERILAKLGLGPSSFDLVACADGLGARGKPEPGAFQSVLTTLGVESARCWSIGDKYTFDILPLVRSGGSGILISGPHELTAAVDHVLARIEKGE